MSRQQIHPLPRQPSPSYLRSILYPLVWILDLPIFFVRLSLRVRHVLLISSFIWGAPYVPGLPEISVPVSWSDFHINFVDPENGCPKVPICDSNHSSFLDVGVRIPVPTGIGRWLGNLRAAFRCLEGLGGWIGGNGRPGGPGK